jgi:hypothetical protein
MEQARGVSLLDRFELNDFRFVVFCFIVGGLFQFRFNSRFWFCLKKPQLTRLRCGPCTMLLEWRAWVAVTSCLRTCASH